MDMLCQNKRAGQSLSSVSSLLLFPPALGPFPQFFPPALPSLPLSPVRGPEMGEGGGRGEGGGEGGANDEDGRG